jgi:transcriptional regulator with XRE-family HTH domain
MRGEEKRKVRVSNLRRLNERFTFKQIADMAGVNDSYLSQIATEFVAKGRKGPRALSDDYVEKIERGLGLTTGWMDHPHDDNAEAGQDPEVGVPDDLEALIQRASPRSRAQLERIAAAAADGRLSDEDVALLELIAKRLGG